MNWTDAVDMRRFTFSLAVVLLVTLLLLALSGCATTGFGLVGATLKGSTGTIDLHTEHGPCIAPALAAMHTTPSGVRVPGCWISGHGMVLVNWLDGDQSFASIEMFKVPSSL